MPAQARFKHKTQNLLSIDQAATLIGRSTWTLRRDVASGRLHAIRGVNRRLWFEPSELLRFAAVPRRLAGEHGHRQRWEANNVAI